MRTQTTDDGDVILASGEEPIVNVPSTVSHVTMADYLKANYVNNDDFNTRLSHIGLSLTKNRVDITQIGDRVRQIESEGLSRAAAVGNVRATQTAQVTRIREIEEKMLTLTWIVAILFLTTAASVAKLFLV